MKTAIFLYSDKMPNRGGPSGYLYNLYEGFSEMQAVPDFICIQKMSNTSQQGEVKKKNLSAALLELRALAYFVKISFKMKKELRGRLSGYDLIHTHSLTDAFNLRRVCGYRGKLILTPHHPEPIANEKVKELEVKAKGNYYFVRKLFEYVQKKAFAYVDGFIFPSKGAMQIYHSFQGFTEQAKGKPIEYVYTGVAKPNITLDREAYRKEHGIPQDAFVIAYVGRHNWIKGYDRLVHLFPKMKESNMQVVVAGGINGWDYPKDAAWMELGYITDAANLMNAADVIAIPNRNTYFDLVIIEALSLGKIVISSNTGGNVDIAQKTDGLILFDNEREESLFDAILRVKEMDEMERKRLENASQEFYYNYSTIDKFASGYLNALHKICKKLFH